jgi:ABC-type phosphate transport system substrate-binding protein
MTSMGEKALTLSLLVRGLRMPDVQGRRGRARLPRFVATLAILAVPAALGMQSAGAAVARPQVRLATTSSTGDTKCSTASNRVTTCTGTYGGGRAWDMTNWNNQTGHELSAQPAVTVSPTTDLVSQVVHVSWSNFTPTIGNGSLTAEPNADDGASGGDPLELYNLAIFECSGTNPQSPVGDGTLPQSKDCYDISNVTQVQATAGAANGVIGFTSSKGTGQANMYVEAGPENSFLHCGVSSPCSLVIVPNWGGEQAPAKNATTGKPLTPDCTNHTQDDGGLLDGESVETASYVSIGAQCSWADRIVVPLSFAPSSANCPTTSTPVFQVEGSPMMENAMEQWQAGWCTGRSALSFQYTPEDEYLAREFFLEGSGALNASVDMALVTQPANGTDSNGAQPTARQYTYAPLANSAIAFAYDIDNPNTGEPFTNLVLNARLAAKLLTQSYALGYDCTEQPPPDAGQKPLPAASSTCDPAVSHNPDTIFDDPEFYDLNGGDTAKNVGQFPADNSFADTLDGVFLPTVDAETTDMTYDMTGWMQSDPTARAFLNGQAATGTIPGTGKTSMTVNKYYRDIAYPTDEFEPLDSGWSVEPDVSPGGLDESIQAAWNPVVNLDTVATDLATYAPTSVNPVPICGLTACTGNTGYKNPNLTGEYLGQDQLTGVVSESQAAADQFSVFQLVNAAGKAVGPTSASILAAVSQMTTNPDGITQSANFASKDPAAYPLTMVDYAMVPTCGLPAAKASAISAFLTDVATEGQTAGDLPGQLAEGYVPLNSHQLAQLKSAASAVKAQHCAKGGGGPTGGTTGGAGAAGNTGGTGSGAGSKSGKGGTTPQTAAKLGKGEHPAGYAVKDPFTAGLARLILPLLVIVGGLLGLGGPAVYVVGVTGGWSALHRRFGTLPHRVAGLVRGTWARRS